MINKTKLNLNCKVEKRGISFPEVQGDYQPTSTKKAIDFT